MVQKCVALYDFEGRSKKELSFKVGNEINVQTKLNGGWWIGELNGEVGLFPLNYVEVKPEEDAEPWYPKIKLKVAPSSLIERLQRECGLVSEKKELTKLERKKISDTITDLQNKMEATLSKNFALQQQGGSSSVISNRAVSTPERKSSESNETESTKDSESSSHQDSTSSKILGRDRPLGPRGRKQMSRGHLQTMKMKSMGNMDTSAINKDNVNTTENSNIATTEKSGNGVVSNNNNNNNNNVVIVKPSVQDKENIVVPISNNSSNNNTKTTSVTQKDEGKSLADEIRQLQEKVKQEESYFRKKDDDRRSERSKVSSPGVPPSPSPKPEARRHKKSPSTVTSTDTTSAASSSSSSSSPSLEKPAISKTTSIQDLKKEVESEEGEKKKSKKKEIRDLSRKLRAESKVRLQLESEIEKLKQEMSLVQTSSTSLSEKSKKSKLLKEELEKARREIDKFSSENSVLLQQMKSLQSNYAQLSESENVAKAALKELQSKESTRASLSQDVESWRKKEQIAREKEEAATAKNKELQLQLSKLNEELSEKDRLLTRKDGELKSLAELKENTAASNRQLTLELAKTNEALKLMEDSKKFHGQSMEMLTSKISSLEATITALRKKDEQSEQHTKTLDEKIAVLETLLRSKDDEIAQFRQTVRSESNTNESKVKELKEYCDTLLSEKYDLEIKYRQEAEHLTKDLQEKEEHLQALQKQEAENKLKYDDKLEALQQSLKSLENSYHDEKQKSVYLQEKLSKAEKANEEITSTLNSKIGELEANMKLESQMKQLTEDKLRQLELKLGGEVLQITNVKKDKEVMIESLQTQLNESLSQLQDLREKLVNERGKTEQLLTQHQKTIDQKQALFTQQINDMRVRHSQEMNEFKLETKRQLAEKDQDIKAKQKTVDELRGLSRITQNTINELTEKNRKLEEENNKLNQSIKTLETLLDEEKNKASSTSASTVDEFEKLKSQDQKIIQHLTEQLNHANSLLSENQKHAEKEIQTLRDQYDQKIQYFENTLRAKSSSEKEEMQSQLEQRNLISTLENNLSLLKQEYDLYVQKVKEERLQIVHNYQEEISQLNLKHTREKEDLEIEMSRRSKSNSSSLESVKDEADKRFDTLNAQWDLKLKHELETLKTLHSQQLTSLKTNENELQRKLKAKTEKLRALKLQLKESERKLSDYQRMADDNAAKRSFSMDSNDLPSSRNNSNSNLSSGSGVDVKNSRAFDEIVELRMEKSQIEAELEEQEAKYAKLKSEFEIAKQAHQAKIEELQAQCASMKDLKANFESKEQEYQDSLQAEKKIRDQLQVRLREFEMKLDTLQRETDEYYREEAAAREHRLKELNSISDNKKNIRVYIEEKHHLDSKVKSLERELQNQKKLFNELESAFAHKLESLISTIDSEYEKRDQLEVENRNLVIRLDEVEDLLVEETKIRRHIEACFVEQAQKTMELELELLEDSKMQTKLKEEVASKLDGFCNTLDTMYDKQMRLQEEKKNLECIVEELEQKLLDEAKLRVELNEKLATEAELRSQLENNFIDKLEKLSLLIMSEKEGSTYEDVDSQS